MNMKTKITLVVLFLIFKLTAQIPIPPQTHYFNINSSTQFQDTLSVGNVLNTNGFGAGVTYIETVETSQIDTLSPFINLVNTTTNQMIDSISSGLRVFTYSYNAYIEIRNPCQIKKFTIKRYTGSGWNYYVFNVHSNDAVNVKEYSNNLGFKTYPNPALNEFYVSLNENTSKPIELSLFDFTGQLVIKDSYSQSSDHKVNIEKLSSGIYFLQITIDGKSSIQKIVKE